MGIWRIWAVDTSSPVRLTAAARADTLDFIARGVMRRPLTIDLDREELRPYFLWDEDLSIAELRTRLAEGSESERLRLMAKILREARDDEVWRFVTLRQVMDRWEVLAPHLGRRRAFWEFLLDAWKRLDLVA